MQAILLAGGLGTRLRSVVSDRPKPMALICLLYTSPSPRDTR